MKAYLILADGTCYPGRAIGKIGTVLGETVFCTGMTGYQEVLTDPSYVGQIVAMTYPMIGNYGMNHEDNESRKSWLKGFVLREEDKGPSNFRSEGELDQYLQEQGIVGIEGIDTRALTRRLRDCGTMNGAIVSQDDYQSVEQVLTKIEGYQITGSVDAVTIEKPEVYDTEAARYHIAMMDYGYKRNILRSLLKRGCKVTVLPARTSAADVLAGGYDGIMLSNGPGNPTDNQEAIENLREIILSKIPMFGICLGHQLMALAMGATTEKLKYGHRGANHPVKDLAIDRTYVTSQNHGYAVVADSVNPKVGHVSHINMNDNTVEGVEYVALPAFTVQFHPEASPGPQDTAYLFDRFLEMVEKGGKK